jgi:hypothetical protein
MGCSIANGRQPGGSGDASLYGHESNFDLYGPYGRPATAYPRSDFGGGSQYSAGHQSAVPAPSYVWPQSARASALFSTPQAELPEMGVAIPLHRHSNNPFSGGGLAQSRSEASFAPPPFPPPPGFLPSDEQIAADIRNSTLPFLRSFAMRIFPDLCNSHVPFLPAQF